MVKRISLERELALWKDGRPLGRDETESFRALIEKNKAGIEGLACTDREVAFNSIEIKFSLISRDAFRVGLGMARREIEDLSSGCGYSVYWTNQPLHRPLGHNGYFTTMAFPEVTDFLVHANSLHIHFETGKDEAFRAYRQMNCLAPWFLMNSRQKGQIMDRLDLVRAFRKEMGELFLPQFFFDDEGYSDYMRRSSAAAQKRLEGNGNHLSARAAYGHLFSEEGVLALSPDKVFHPARYRPDLLLPNGNISVEFRAMDGVLLKEKELTLIDTALIAFDAALDEPDIMQMPLLRQFYEELSTSSRAYRTADDFVQEAMKSATGAYLEAVNE